MFILAIAIMIKINDTDRWLKGYWVIMNDWIKKPDRRVVFRITDQRLDNSGSLRITVTDKIAWANELDYTVTALISRKCIKSMTYMIAVIYEFDLRIYVIQYDTWSLSGI